LCDFRDDEDWDGEGDGDVDELGVAVGFSDGYVPAMIP
jgi:hypothetical protein